MDEEDLFLILLAYHILQDFELKLLGPDARIDNPPPNHLGVYENAFEARLKFFLFSFVLKLHKSYGILESPCASSFQILLDTS